MNTLFWIALLVLLLVAVIILIYPLLRVRPSAAIAYKDSNLGLYDDKLAELEADLGEGRIDHEQYQSARQEIDRELLKDIPAESRDTASVHYSSEVRRQPVLALMISVFIPMLAFLVYMQLGMHASTVKQPGQMQAQAQPQQQGGVGSVEEMTRQLAARLQQQGGSQEEWAMLGRAYKHIGQYVLSAEAFAQAVKIKPTAQLMLEQSESLALGNNQSFTPQARDLVMRALEMEPDNINVLWFAGVAEFQAGNYRNSIEHLSRLSAQAQQDQEINRSLRLYIDKARNQLIAAGEAVPTTDEILGTSAAASKDAAAGASVTVKVDINDDVRSRFSDGDSVFVGKLPVALIVCRDGHHRALAVGHQHEIRDVDRHFVTGNRMNRFEPGIHTELLSSFDTGFGYIHGLATGDKQRNVFARLRGLLRQRMFSCYSDIGHTHQCIRPCSEYLQRFVVALDAEVNLDPFRTANPVALHRHHALGPLVQLVKIIQQFLRVVGDLHEPLRDFLANYRRVTTPAAALNYLLIGQHCLIVGAPVYGRCFFVNQAFCEQACKQPLFPPVVVWRAGRQFTPPIVGKTETL